MNKEEPDREERRIKSKHKMPLEEIRESVCESGGADSWEEEGTGGAKGLKEACRQ